MPIKAAWARVLILSAGVFTGCAIHYYDSDTGAEHIWGVGHLVMKASVPNEGHQAVVRGTEVIGISLGKADDGGYFTLGWDKRYRVEILDENAAIRLEWPESNFLKTRIGSEWPGKSRTDDGQRGY